MFLPLSNMGGRRRVDAARRMGSPKRPEGRPQLFHQIFRLLEGGEMAAPGQAVVVDQLWIGPFRPAARRLVYLLRKGADSDRRAHSDRLVEVDVVLLDAEP